MTKYEFWEVRVSRLSSLFIKAHRGSGSSIKPASELKFRPNNFDLIRIFAAMQVIVFHFFHRMHYAEPSALAWLGVFPGVPIFFVTSGYLVSASFERQSGNTFNYFKNRFLRIFPGLWVCVLVTLATVLIFGFHPAKLLDYLWLPIQMMGAIYTPPYLKSFGCGSYNGSLWTIPIELQFYIILPLVYGLIKKLRLGNKGYLVLFAMATVFAVLQSIYAPFDFLPGQIEPIKIKLLRYTFAPHVYLFLLGVVLQRFQIHKWRLVRGKAYVWIPAYAIWAAHTNFGPVWNVFHFIVLGVVTLSAAYTAPRIAELVLHGQDISYGTYIYHGLIINILIELSVRPGLGALACTFAATCVAAMLSWKLVEQPCIRLKQRTRRPAMPEVLAGFAAEPSGTIVRSQ